ncbi:MAG TPA: adenosylcobinamide-GDP ribazoletransferase [Anaeromyxobacter sp.]
MSLPVESAAPPRARRAAERVVRDLLLAFAFLTRLPVPPRLAEGADLGRSSAWFPVAGAAMGLLVAAAAHVAGPHLHAPLAAVLVVAALAWMTGGLHLDGVADVFDGLGGGHGDRERTLRIMRDSRIGAHGATALVLVLAVKVAALSDLLARGSLWPLVVAPVVARFAVVPLLVLFPSAREEGLGRAFHGTAGGREIAIAGVLAAAAVAPFAPASLVPVAAALATAAAVALSVSRRLGGLTGDVYGAAIEIAEAALLAAATLR